MKKIVFETLNRQGRITREDDVKGGPFYVMYMKNDFTGRYNRTARHRHYPANDKMFAILVEWMGRNLQDRPQGAFFEPSP